MPPIVREATLDDLPGYFDDMRAQLPDNGRDGVWFTTVRASDADARFSPERLAEVAAACQRPVEEPRWMRVFIVEDEGRVVGHADLSGGPVATMLHRCTLGLGLQRPYRGRGLGRALMDAAIGWARGAGLAWIDLGVVAGNERARALYLELGFVEVGRVPDRFRFDGASLTDIIMALDLGALSSTAARGSMAR
ncbi:MAG: GNAT family N-acetyltransferase [Deltaproteobacteria bacterium]|nr:GNAT family N-acetyltransferase [Deltaproteobacteria bacterium]